MRTGILLFTLGVVFLTELPVLPDAAYVSFLPLCVLAAWLSSAARPLALFVCGLLWALLHAQWQAMGALPASLEGRLLLVDGTIAGLPADDPQRARFDFQIVKARRDGALVRFRGKVRLSWYLSAPRVQPGEQWQLAVRLKRPRGRVNPGGTDYERWLFTHGIAATGYVVPATGNRLAGPEGAGGLDGFRHRLSSAIGVDLGGHAAGAIVRALAVGDRSAMTREQWRTLRATGTSHLMAISGLHIGLVAGMAYFLVLRLWSAAATPVLWVPAPRVAAIVALVAGLVYAGLAGFALPTQRALVMLTVFMAGVILARRVAPGASFCLALAAVLAWDPLAVLSAGFWLSFGAVAAILFGMSGRLRGTRLPRWQALWWRWGRVQWLVAVGLLPATLGWFFEYPLVAPLANLLAVPWAGLVLVPLVLAASALLLPFPTLGGVLLAGARWAVEVLWQFLEILAGLELILRPQGAPPGLALAAACVGAALLIAPRGVPGRALGLVWLLPLLSLPAPRPEHGAYWMTLLDAGQGLAVVLRTHSHVMVYDTGPRYPAGFDAGRDVVLPYLRHQGVEHVDLLIVSHGHNDHMGGAGALLDGLPVAAVMSNVVAGWPRRKPCVAGTDWHWDGVAFQVLHPGYGEDDHGNNGSCVLKVSGRGGRLLLPGDVEESAEAAMLARVGEGLQATVLVVPHHGARGSSSGAFLDAVRPRIALFSSGYRNRYRFPHRQVVRRLADRGVEMFDTARHGAITLKFDAGDGVRRPRLERVASARIWRGRD